MRKSKSPKRKNVVGGRNRKKYLPATITTMPTHINRIEPLCYAERERQPFGSYNAPYISHTNYKELYAEIIILILRIFSERGRI